MNRPFANRRSSQFRIPNSEFRLGFTLVELLIVITVIGILVGLLLPAINGAMRSARELAMRTEMVQIEQAVESFKTEYGFYPPSFEQFAPGAAADTSHPGLAAFLRYLNRIAPNHQEAISFVGGGSRIVVWWNKVGQHLDDQSSLVFWLSGLCQNKQFPITGGNPDSLIPPFGPDTSFTAPNGSVVEINRDRRFEFQPNQLVYGVTANDTSDITTSETTIVTDPTTGAVQFVEADSLGGNNQLVAAYKQPYGPSNGDLNYRYRDSSSYFFPPYAYLTDVGPTAMLDNDFDGTADTVPDPTVFINPKTFQLISLGLDGEAGVPVEEPTSDDDFRENAFVFSTDPNFIKFGYDNMANFADGRLELFVIENE